MGIGETIVAIVLILCFFISLWIYMFYCGENRIKMFSDPRYERRISKLEKQVEELMKNR